MSVVVDTSVVIAALNGADRGHVAVRDWIVTVDEDLVTSPLAVAEMDHLVGASRSTAGTEALRRDLDEGVYAVRWWADALSETLALARRRPGIGLTDASLVALAARLGTTRIATLDHRHFRTLTAPDGSAFTLLPADHRPPAGATPT